MFRLSGMLLLATVSIAAMSQTASPLVGKWGGTMKMANGNENDVVLVIRPHGGTWRFFSRGKGRSPCLTQDFPVAVLAMSETEVTLKVEGDSVLKGCFDAELVFKATSPTSIESALSDGRPLVFSRQ